MRLSHADFRPKKRSGVVPSGKPRRRIPVLRILLLILIAIFVYIKFDSLWAAVRPLNPVALWDRAFGAAATAQAPGPVPVYSADSSEFSLDCPRGLEACRAVMPPAAENVGAEAMALLARARARRALNGAAAGSPLRLHARAALSRAGQPRFELAALQGRDEGGAYALRNTGSAWCDNRRGCLSGPPPRAPLAAARLIRREDGRTGDGLPTRVQWVSATSAARPSLPGIVSAVDSVNGGARVRVYHGKELYTSYEPLKPAADIRPGAVVTTGTVLGEAPWLAAGYTVYQSVRRAGLNVDPADFFSLQPANAPDPGAEAP